MAQTDTFDKKNKRYVTVNTLYLDCLDPANYYPCFFHLEERSSKVFNVLYPVFFNRLLYAAIVQRIYKSGKLGT